MYECISIVPARVASSIGFNEPAAKGAMVRGIRPMEIALPRSLVLRRKQYPAKIDYLSKVQ